jgi:hypothetical protein
MKINKEMFSLDFKYDQKTRILDVEFADGSVTRFYDIDPRSAFLSDTNPRRNRDFFNFLEWTQQSDPVKSETIRDPDPALQPGEPQTRPNLVSQQSGASWTRQWGHK